MSDASPPPASSPEAPIHRRPVEIVTRFHERRRPTNYVRMLAGILLLLVFLALLIFLLLHLPH